MDLRKRGPSGTIPHPSRLRRATFSRKREKGEPRLMQEADAALVPHHTGHREWLRKGDAAALAYYELLELILFRAIPRRDVKPIAKALFAHFGFYAEALAGRPAPAAP